MELAEKIQVSKSQMIRYELKGVQPPADTLNKLAEIFNTSVDYLINGNIDEKAKAALHDAELLQRFKEVETPRARALRYPVSAWCLFEGLQD